MKIKNLMAWAILSLVTGGLLFQFNGSRYWMLLRRGVQTEGTVIEILPQMHETVRYQYSAHGKVFQGREQSAPPNPPLKELSIGQKVIVYYDPNQTETSTLGSPKKLLFNEIISVGLPSLFIPLVIIFVWRLRAFYSYRGTERVTPINSPNA
jgi:hypothetical protein